MTQDKGNVIKFPRNMRGYIRIVEQADADDMYGEIDPVTFGRRDGQAFSDRGRADLKIRPNDPRFADNPMAGPGQGASLEEFAVDETTPQLDQLHQALTKAGLSDLEIRQGVELTHTGMEKIAGRLGRSPKEVEMLINTLVQNLRDADGSETDALLSDYYGGMSEGSDAPIWSKRHRDRDSFKQGTMIESRFSIEPDALGNITIRDAETGRERFIQGSEASALRAKLGDGAQNDQILAPLMEAEMNAETDSGFDDEIEADSGSYNFPWSTETANGTGTVLYKLKDASPSFKMISVRSMTGDEILDTLTASEYKEVLEQAKNFIQDA